MLIKTKKRGEIEVGGDEKISKALSCFFGSILDEMYDLVVENTTLTMWPDKDLTICISVGGDDCSDEDLKTTTIEKLIMEAVLVADAKERDAMRKKLIKIAESL